MLFRQEQIVGADQKDRRVPCWMKSLCFKEQGRRGRRGRRGMRGRRTGQEGKAWLAGQGEQRTWENSGGKSRLLLQWATHNTALGPLGEQSRKGRSSGPMVHGAKGTSQDQCLRSCIPCKTFYQPF